MLINILLLIMILLRLVIGMRLVTTARQNNQPNLYWNAAHFFTVAIGVFFAPTVGNPLGNLPMGIWMFLGVATVTTTFLVIAFTHTTFYRDRKSPLWWYVGCAVILAVITVVGLIRSESNSNQNPLVSFAHLGITLVVTWHGWCAYRALKGIATEPSVEDWIKARYRLIIFVVIVTVIDVIASIIRIVFVGGSAITPLGNAMGLVELITQILSVIAQFLAWIMPENFRVWLNRNQQAHIDEKLRERALAILNILASAVSDGTGLSSMTALIALRKMIGQDINTEDSRKISERAIAMRYVDWQALLKTRDCYLMIESLGGKVDARKAVDNATLALTEKQSLFTMQAK